MKSGPPKSRRPRSRSSPRGSRPASTSAPDRGGRDWLAGPHSVAEALRAGRRRIDRLLIGESDRHGDHDALISLAHAAGVPIERADDRTLERVAGVDLRFQRVALEVGPLPELSLEALLAGVAASEGGGGESGRRPGRRIVVLDGVEDPQNVGAIARVAESAGCAGMILTDRRAPPITAAVSRASAGAIEWLPVARVTNLVRALEELKQARFWVLAAAIEQGESLFALSDRVLSGDLAVVLGAEGKGIRPGILEQADHRIRIPMRGQVESLNVATAGAVILYELLRRAESGSD